MSDAARWLAAAQAGSREALGQALEAYRGYLLLVAQEELAPELRAKAGASDLVQDTFLEAQRDFAHFQGQSEEEFRGWLRQVLRHNLANFARRYRGTDKRRLDREVALDADDSTAERGGGLAADQPSPSGAVMAQEQAEILRRVLDRLPEDYREILLLRYEEQLPFEEIAVRMGRSSAAVRQLWSRALRRARLELGDPP